MITVYNRNKRDTEKTTTITYNILSNVTSSGETTSGIEDVELTGEVIASSSISGNVCTLTTIVANGVIDYANCTQALQERIDAGSSNITNVVMTGDVTASSSTANHVVTLTTTIGDNKVGYDNCTTELQALIDAKEIEYVTTGNTWAEVDGILNNGKLPVLRVDGYYYYYDYQGSMYYEYYFTSPEQGSYYITRNNDWEEVGDKTFNKISTTTTGDRTITFNAGNNINITTSGHTVTISGTNSSGTTGIYWMTTTENEDCQTIETQLSSNCLPILYLNNKCYLFSHAASVSSQYTYFFYSEEGDYYTCVDRDWTYHAASTTVTYEFPIVSTSSSYNIVNGYVSTTNVYPILINNNKVYYYSNKDSDNSYYFMNGDGTGWKLTTTDTWSEVSTGGGGTQVQSNWNEQDSSSMAYILNKPDLSQYVMPYYDAEVPPGVIGTVVATFAGDTHTITNASAVGNSYKPIFIDGDGVVTVCNDRTPSIYYTYNDTNYNYFDSTDVMAGSWNAQAAYSKSMQKQTFLTKYHLNTDFFTLLETGKIDGIVIGGYTTYDGHDVVASTYRFAGTNSYTGNIDRDLTAIVSNQTVTVTLYSFKNNYYNYITEGPSEIDVTIATYYYGDSDMCTVLVKNNEV